MRNYYVLCDDNCRFPAMTKDEVLEDIEEAAEEHTPTHEKIKTNGITDINKKVKRSLWIGTQAEYNAIATKSDDVIYLVKEHYTRYTTDIAPKITSVSTAQTTIETKHSTLNQKLTSYETTAALKSDKIDELLLHVAGVRENVRSERNTCTIIKNSFNTYISKRNKIKEIGYVYDTQTGTIGLKDPITDYREVWLLTGKSAYKGINFWMTQIVKIPTSIFTGNSTEYIPLVQYQSGELKLLALSVTVSNDALYILGLGDVKVFGVGEK